MKFVIPKLISSGLSLVGRCDLQLLSGPYGLIIRSEICQDKRSIQTGNTNLQSSSTIQQPEFR